MPYTVKELAKISGITVRTLHHYDEIELLKPAYHGSNNYRYYEEEQLLMLQQILFYRELGMSLNDVQRIMGSSEFNKIKALQSHKRVLLQSIDRTHLLIKTIDKTVKHLKGKVKMKDEEFFYGLDSPKQKEYEKALMKSGKVTQQEIKVMREKTKYLDEKKIQKDADKFYKNFAKLIDEGYPPASPQVQKMMGLFYEILHIFYTPTKEKFLGLIAVYNEWPDYDKFFGRYHPKLKQFLQESMKVYAEREL